MPWHTCDVKLCGMWQTQLLQLKEENYCLDDQCKCQEKGDNFIFFTKQIFYTI